MFRTAMCIKMLIKLKSQNKVTTREMAEYLDTNPRNIREFRKELEAAGYRITEIRGRLGGYTLDDRSCLPVPALKQEEVSVLDEARRFMASHPEFTQAREYEEILDKFLCSCDAGKQTVSLSYHSGSRPLPKEVMEMLEMAEKAIQDQESLILTYQGRDKDESSDVKVDPYHIVCIDDHYYLIGWSHKAKDYRNYKFSEYRMIEMKQTGQSFLKDPYFNYASYIGTNSAFKDKLCIYTVQVRESVERLFREQHWGTGLEKVDSSEPGWYTYRFTSDDSYGTYMRLFEFGKDVELLEPREKRKEFARRLFESIPHYSDMEEDIRKETAFQKQTPEQMAKADTLADQPAGTAGLVTAVPLAKEHAAAMVSLGDKIKGDVLVR